MHYSLIETFNKEFSSLSKEKQLVVKSIQQGENVFVTGGAGTGKTYLLNFIKRYFADRNLSVTASTGIAAVNIAGATIHSWAGIGLGNLPVNQIVKNIFSAKFSKIRKRILNTKILAIDEVSMLSTQTLDLISEVLKAVKDNPAPMGGIQTLFFGDFLQLPPVANNNMIDFCFNSKTWKDLNLEIFNLEEIYRQKDSKLINLLQNLRIGNIGEDEIEILKSRTNIADNNKAIRPTILTSHNNRAHSINQQQLNAIPQEIKTFKADYFGDKKKIELLKKNSIAAEVLTLKVGAQVMMIKNTYQKEGVINGSLGIVKGFSSKKSYPIVEFNNGTRITVKPEEWLIEKFDEKKKELVCEAGVNQIPLIMSWAITIHKSQGLTLDKISCDLSNIFSPGQAYVALSRARSLEGIYISSIDFGRIRADESAVSFYKKIS